MKKVLIIVSAILSICFSEHFVAFREHDYSLLFANLPEHPIDERRKIAIRLLKDFHAHAQKNLIRRLEALRANNPDKISFKPLWLLDAVIIETDRNIVNILSAEFPEYDFIVEHEQFAELTNARHSVIAMDTFPPESLVWGIDTLHIRQTWEIYGTYGDGVLVAILDSGLEPWHSDIIGGVFENVDEGFLYNSIDDDGDSLVDDIWGYNFIDTTSHPYDDRGHGTHVSGTACGRNGIGVAPRARILPLKVLNSHGSGRPSIVWLATQFALEIGADIANYSIGWHDTTTAMKTAWRTAMTNAITAGLVIVAGAGNEGGMYGAPNNLRLPGAVPEVITVGAIDTAKNIASFSSVGPVEWSDHPYPPGLIKPDVVAPGVGILSSIITGGRGLNSGTSMATPHVVGICALLKQLNPELTHQQIKAIIESTAVDLGPAGKDSIYGSGLVDPVEALASATSLIRFRWSSTESGTLIVMPYELRFFGDSGVAKVPDSSQFLIFKADGFVPETLSFSASDSIYLFSPVPVDSHMVRFVLLDFNSGALIEGWVIVDDDTHDISGSGRIMLPEVPMLVYATAPGYNMDSAMVSDTSSCAFFFLHHCIDFEDSSFFSDTGDWEWGVPSSGPDTARSGRKVWATSLADTYSNSSDSWLRTAWFDVDSGAMLCMWHWYDCEATSWGFWDGGNVSADFGSGWQVIFPIGDYTCWLDSYNSIMPWEPAFSGMNLGNFWHQSVFVLQNTAPCSVRFALHFSSDDNTTRDGWYIDDFCVIARTTREPLITSVLIDGDSAVIAAYAVNSAIDSLYALSADSVVFIGERICCDTFVVTFYGDTGETIYFQIVAVDTNGRVATYPTDSMLRIIMPPVVVKEFLDRKGIVIENIGDGRILCQGVDYIEVFDVMGRRLVARKLKADKFYWKFSNSGIYFIRAVVNGNVIRRKIVILK